MASPGEDVQAWSTTAATNANADPLINWAEGQPRASVNNSARSELAAHAKKRNLENGSITTGGSANAQTFTSGVGYTTPVPTGLRVMLKVGFTNTGAATLNMDGIGAVAIKDQFGADLGANVLIAGQYVELLYNGTNWILLEGNTSLLIAPQCGRLTYVSTTALSFTPFNGDRIKINGAIYAIPSAGITGLANTGVYVNGVAAQNLVLNTTYWVYAFSNSGVVTADFSTTTHATSTTAGNVGTEIKSGDNTRTLIGQVRADGSAQFQSSATNRYVISWFNRRSLEMRGASTAGANTASGSPAVLSAGATISFVAWNDEAFAASVEGGSTNSITDANCSSNIFFDSATALLGQSVLCNCGPSGAFGSNSGTTYATPAAEGLHTLTPLGAVTAGTGTFYLCCNAMIRG